MPISTHGAWHTKPDDEGHERWRLDLVYFPTDSALPLLFATWTVLEIEGGCCCQTWINGQKIWDGEFPHSVAEQVHKVDTAFTKHHQATPALLWHASLGVY